MPDTLAHQRRQLGQLDRDALARYQLDRLNQLLAAILPSNTFYQRKFSHIRLPLQTLDQLRELPLTDKQELVAHADSQGVGGHGSFPPERYTRMHRTSGTAGRPLTILDTDADWSWWVETWQYVLDAAQITPSDRALMAFSFGPFVGFWSAYEALVHRGALVIPTGGMSTSARLEMLRQTAATCVCCTPTYAIRMAETAGSLGVSLRDLNVRCLIVAGEPGGSIPSVRDTIEAAWGARVIDHSGATEVGPWGFPDSGHQGLHVIESEFVAEFLPCGDTPDGDTPDDDPPLAELVLTSLGRYGMPAIRYRTGDLVRPQFPPPGQAAACRFVRLEGGILGRADDMVIIRGVNIFPSSIEAMVREFPEIVEFRVRARRTPTLDELQVEVEGPADIAARLAELMRQRLGLRIDVQCVPADSLPRYEAKSRRFVDER